MKVKIRYMADLCVQMNVPKHKVISKIYADLGGEEDSFYKLRHIYNILDAEYQNENLAILQKPISSIPNEFEEGNTDLIALTDRLISYFKDNFRKKLSTNHIQKAIPKEVLKEDMYALNNLLDTAEEALDDRVTVLEIQQHELFRLIAAYGPAFAAVEFLNVKTPTLTPKQTTNYRLGHVRNLRPIFCPHDEQEALSSPAKYYGVPCKFMWCKDCEHGNKITSTICIWCNGTNLEKQGCGSWNIEIGNQADEKYTVHCFACQADFIPTTKPLPKTGNTTVIDYQVATHNATVMVNEG